MAQGHLFSFSMLYVGRFAPSPSGRLHFGSLICALGSYLRARSLKGKLILRIEDLDFYRCNPEYTTLILKELDLLGFEYDEYFVQSEHTDEYLALASTLIDEGKAFLCNCTRAYLKDHECTCHTRKISNPQNCAVKIRLNEDSSASFYDVLRGQVPCPVKEGALTLVRRDKVVAYNLACVADDIRQGVTEVVRGADLIDITTSQMRLYSLLGHQSIDYLHLPLVMADATYKLSKQNRSPAALDLKAPSELLIIALKFIGQDTSGFSPLLKPRQILDEAVSRFNLSQIPTASAQSPI